MSNIQYTQGIRSGVLGATVNPYERVVMNSSGVFVLAVRAERGTHVALKYGVSGDTVDLMPIAGSSEVPMKADGALALGAVVYTSATDGLVSTTSTSAVKLGINMGCSGTVAATASGDIVSVAVTPST